MAVQVVIENVLQDQTRESRVQKFTSRAEKFTLTELESMLSGIISKFQLMPVFHNMEGLRSKHEAELISVDRDRYSTSTTTVKQKEEGLARMYSNGKTSMAIHSYETSTKSDTKVKYHDPLIHVVGYDQKETGQIAEDINLVLLEKLAQGYLEAETEEGRTTIAEDIASNTNSDAKKIYNELNAIIDNELLTLRQQLLSRVLSLAKPDTDAEKVWSDRP